MQIYNSIHAKNLADKNFKEISMNRRNFIKNSALGLGYVSFFAPSFVGATSAKNAPLLGFNGIASSTEDIIKVPKGYEAKPLISWGDKLFSKANAFDERKIIDKKAIANANLTFGDNTDGMAYFPLSQNRGILAVNNEYINPELMFNHNGKDINLNDVKYMQNSLGVSIFEIAKDEGGYYKVVLDSKYNRRITAHTAMKVSGYAKGSPLLQTSADKSGTTIKGTLNNCANGQTPWGTYLSCEENFDDFFGCSDKNFAFTEAQKRYGLTQKSLYGFELDLRFDIAKTPNEPNRFGYVVEIDPYDANSTPIKRTSLGRFKHENAEIVISKDGRVVVYMGDDEANEFLYKFVSKNTYDKENKSANKDILDEGTLYVAKFYDNGHNLDGKGEWIELVWGKNGLDKSNGFESQADICINTRIAASIVGATKMDRPEWIAADNKGQYIYATMTNNTKRKANETNSANPRANNLYGQIIRFRESGDNHAGSKFSYNIFALAGNPLIYKKGDLRAGSSNITKDNLFNSPDGLKFDRFGRLWIETDGKYSNEGEYEGMGNNQMLCANPNTGEIRRFLTAPIASEVTGIAFSPDNEVMFVGIQHPGEFLAPSHYPNGGKSTPRSTIIQIKKSDGGVVGS